MRSRVCNELSRAIEHTALANEHSRAIARKRYIQENERSFLIEPNFSAPRNKNSKRTKKIFFYLLLTIAMSKSDRFYIWHSVLACRNRFCTDFPLRLITLLFKFFHKEILDSFLYNSRVLSTSSSLLSNCKGGQWP